MSLIPGKLYKCSQPANDFYYINLSREQIHLIGESVFIFLKMAKVNIWGAERKGFVILMEDGPAFVSYLNFNKIIGIT